MFKNCRDVGIFVDAALRLLYLVLKPALKDAEPLPAILSRAYKIFFKDRSAAPTVSKILKNIMNGADLPSKSAISDAPRQAPWFLCIT